MTACTRSLIHKTYPSSGWAGTAMNVLSVHSTLYLRTLRRLPNRGQHRNESVTGSCALPLCSASDARSKTPSSLVVDSNEWEDAARDGDWDRRCRPSPCLSNILAINFSHSQFPRKLLKDGYCQSILVFLNARASSLTCLFSNQASSPFSVEQELGTDCASHCGQISRHNRRELSSVRNRNK